MNLKTKRNGILALLGLGALAFWKYKNSSEEERQALKDKCNGLMGGFCKLGNDLKAKANEALTNAKQKVD